jgi:hypothetical protein
VIASPTGDQSGKTIHFGYLPEYDDPPFLLERVAWDRQDVRVIDRDVRETERVM